MTKLIRKAFQGTVPENKILNTFSTSQTDTYSCNYVNQLKSYSTEETIIGTFMNKPLYIKTINCGNLPSNTYKTVAHGIQNYDIIFVDFSASYLSLDNIQFQGANCAICNTYVNGDNIVLNATGDRTAWKAMITVKYTKTTD